LPYTGHICYADYGGIYIVKRNIEETGNISLHVEIMKLNSLGRAIKLIKTYKHEDLEFEIRDNFRGAFPFLEDILFIRSKDKRFHFESYKTFSVKDNERELETNLSFHYKNKTYIQEISQ